MLQKFQNPVPPHSNQWVAVRISSVEAAKLNKSLKHPGDILPKREEEKSRGEREENSS